MEMLARQLAREMIRQLQIFAQERRPPPTEEESVTIEEVVKPPLTPPPAASDAQAIAAQARSTAEIANAIVAAQAAGVAGDAPALEPRRTAPDASEARGGAAADEPVPAPTGPRVPNSHEVWETLEASLQEARQAARAARELEEVAFTWLEDFAGRDRVFKEMAGAYPRLVSDERARQRVGAAEVERRRRQRQAEKDAEAARDRLRALQKEAALQARELQREIFRAQREAGAPTPARWCTFCGSPALRGDGNAPTGRTTRG